jgi:transglycosylase-like protein with SLT domain
MKRWLFLVSLATATALQGSHPASAQQRAQYEMLVEKHAKANLVPAALVHRVIVRESKYQPDLVGRGGTIGLMQIKLATARGVGYQGDAEGLRDPDTNLAFGVKYLAGAYRAANGDHDRAVHYYAAGYYGVAKQQRLERERLKQAAPVLASTPPQDAVKPEEAAKPEEAVTPTPKPEQAAKLEETAKPEQATATPKEIARPKEMPKQAVVKPKAAHKKLAEARETVPRPPAAIPTSANNTKPR